MDTNTVYEAFYEMVIAQFIEDNGYAGIPDHLYYALKSALWDYLDNVLEYELAYSEIAHTIFDRDNNYFTKDDVREVLKNVYYESEG